MGNNPAFQFYPADWERDLGEHPLEIGGAWIRICCKLWWEDTRGTATKSLTNWSRVLRVGIKKSLAIIDYLDKQNIADVDIQNGSITITSRRMVRDEYIRNIRKMAGSLGGNPSLKPPPENNVLDKQTLVNQNPTPSSSSSSSKKKKESIKKEKIVMEQDGKFGPIPDDLMKKWREVAPGVDIMAEVRKAELWLLANPKKRRSRYEAFLSNWMVRAQDRYIKYGGGNGRSRDSGSREALQDEITRRADEINRAYRDAQQAAANNPRGDAETDDVPDFQEP